MKSFQHVKTMSQRAIAAVMSLTLAVAFVPVSSVSAYADEISSSGTVVADGSWTLSYEVTDGTASITGIVASPDSAASLSVPSSVVIDGTPVSVTKIADNAFVDNDKLGAVTIPDSVTIIGHDAFKRSSLTAVSIPSSVAYIPYRAFFGCAALSRVSFASGMKLEYIGTAAFRGCSSLAELEIPILEGDVYRSTRYTEAGNAVSDFRIGYNCFTACTSLTKIVFLPGASNGSRGYMKDGGQQFGGGVPSNLVIINYNKGSNSRYTNSNATYYFAVNFYASKEDCAADATHTNYWKQGLYKSGSNILDILEGDAQSNAYEGTGEIPSLPSNAQDAGMVWGVADGVMASAFTTLTGSIDVYPVDKGDLAFAWVSSPEIRASAGYPDGDIVSANQSYVRLGTDGLADLSGMKAYAGDGSVIDSEEYVLKYERNDTGNIVNVNTGSVWTELSSPEEVNRAGTYRVHAEGVGAYSNTKTATVEFTVRGYDPVIDSYTSSTVVNNLGDASFAGMGMLKESPEMVVVTSSKKWQYALVATGLAGTANSQVIYSDGEKAPSSAYRAVNVSKADVVNFVGTTGEIGSEVESTIRNTLVGTDRGTFNRFSGATEEALSLDVYNKVAQYGEDLGYTWGDTAVVVSGSRAVDSAAIAQYVYQAKAPVFFMNSSGALSAGTLSALRSGGFNKVIIAGSEACVSQSVASSVESATGIAPERLADEGYAYGASESLIDSVLTTFVDSDNASVNTVRRAVIANAQNPVNAIAGGQLAAARGGVLLSVASTADLKAAIKYLDEKAGSSMNSAYLVGDFRAIDASAEDKVSTVWSGMTNVDLVTGDTIEHEGILYRIASGRTASACQVIESSAPKTVAASVTRMGIAYSLAKGSVASASITLSNSRFVYDGKRKVPSVRVSIGSSPLVNGTDYTVSYSNNSNAGTAVVSVIGRGVFTGTKRVQFTIAKAEQSIKVSTSAKSAKAKKLKKKAVATSKVRVTGAKGAVSYQKVKKSSSKLSINAKTGKIKIKKKTKKGTYRIKVKVTAKPTANFNGASKTITIKVKVK